SEALASDDRNTHDNTSPERRRARVRTAFERLGVTAILVLVWQINYVSAIVVQHYAEVFAGTGLTPFVAEHPEVYFLVPVACTIAYLSTGSTSGTWFSHRSSASS